LCNKNYNLKQAELVRKCEEPYRKGMKERREAGTITENLLIDFLQKEFEGKLLFKGIKSCKINTDDFDKFSKEQIKEKLSLCPQTDIIGYSSDEDIKQPYEGLETILYNKVKFIIEVKKKDTIETDQISKLVNYYNSIPIFFISFRGTGARKPVMDTRFANKILKNIADRKDIKIFMLSWQNNKDSRKIKNRLMEGAPETIRIEGFEGQLEKMVKSIKEIII